VKHEPDPDNPFPRMANRSSSECRQKAGDSLVIGEAWDSGRILALAFAKTITPPFATTADLSTLSEFCPGGR